MLWEKLTETLKMQEINDNMFFEEQQENIIRKQEEDQVKEKSVEDNIQLIKNVKKTKKDEEIDENIMIFLHEKGWNENLIETLINIGLTDERVRLAEIDIYFYRFRYSSYSELKCIIKIICKINFIIVCCINKI